MAVFLGSFIISQFVIIIADVPDLWPLAVDELLRVIADMAGFVQEFIGTKGSSNPFHQGITGSLIVLYRHCGVSLVYCYKLPVLHNHAAFHSPTRAFVITHTTIIMQQVLTFTAGSVA